MLREVLMIVGVLAFAEGLFITAFPGRTRRVVARLIKDSKNLRRFGITELVFGLILILVGFYLV